MDVFQIGPLTIRYDWLFAGIAFTVAYFVSEYETRNRTKIQKQFLDALLNGLIIWIVTYKLSVVILRPSILIQNPLGILYFWGGSKGMVVATLLSILYFLNITRRLSLPKTESVKLIVSFIVTFLGVFLAIRTLFQLTL